MTELEVDGSATDGDDNKSDSPNEDGSDENESQPEPE